MIKVLMVCLGNICRSPLAEGILRKKAAEAKLDILIDSAGTSGYHAGECPDARSIANAGKYGVDIANLCSRQFTLEDFDLFDHIYVMDSSNYGNVLTLARNQQDRNKVELLLNILYPEKDMIVPDPYFGGEEGFDQVYHLLDKACEKLVLKLKNEITENQNK